jgi:hypothetical protein
VVFLFLILACVWIGPRVRVSMPLHLTDRCETLQGRARAPRASSWHTKQNKKLSPAGFEPAHIAVEGLKSSPLDHSGKVTVCSYEHTAQLIYN